MKRMQNRIRSLEEEVNRLQGSQETTAQPQLVTEGAATPVSTESDPRKLSFDSLWLDL